MYCCNPYKWSTMLLQICDFHSSDEPNSHFMEQEDCSEGLWGLFRHIIQIAAYRNLQSSWFLIKSALFQRIQKQFENQLEIPTDIILFTIHTKKSSIQVCLSVPILLNKTVKILYTLYATVDLFQPQHYVKVTIYPPIIIFCSFPPSPNKQA